jgi:hypothetical protein
MRPRTGGTWLQRGRGSERKYLICRYSVIWARLGLNQRPLACEARAIPLSCARSPTELRALRTQFYAVAARRRAACGAFSYGSRT